jgi:protein-disulfide isomerase
MKPLVAIAILAFLVIAGCAASPIHEGVAADGRPYRGSATPKVVIYEYSDFECPYCAQVQPTVDQILRTYPNVQLQYRYFPLDIHPRGIPSAIAAVCADEQGKFWQMYDVLFPNQDKLEDADLQKYASGMGLNMTKFNQCLSSDEAAQKVRADMAEGATVGVQATPTFKIGDSIVRGAQPFAQFKSVIDSELARVG